MAALPKRSRGQGGPEPKVPPYRPCIVIVPGGSQNPAHYGYLSHLLLSAGYPVFSALLPSVGTGNVTVEEDAEYIRNKMLLPMLDIENRDVILFTHSYSSVPGSAAAGGLGRGEREKAGKKTAVIGQVCMAAMLLKGGDEKTILETFGGQFPPHIRADTEANLLCCDDRIPPMYSDVEPRQLAEAVAVSAMAQGITSFTSPVPRASWDHMDFKDRLAYIRTVNDAAIPVAVQQMMIDGSGVQWYESDIEGAHSAQLSRPKELAELLVDLAVIFESI